MFYSIYVCVSYIFFAFTFTRNPNPRRSHRRTEISDVYLTRWIVTVEFSTTGGCVGEWENLLVLDLAFPSHLSPLGSKLLQQCMNFQLDSFFCEQKRLNHVSFEIKDVQSRKSCWCQRLSVLIYCSIVFIKSTAQRSHQSSNAVLKIFFRAMKIQFPSTK